MAWDRPPLMVLVVLVNCVAVATTVKCPFCPAPRTTQFVGAADTNGQLPAVTNVSGTIRAARAEGLNVVGFDAISSTELEQLGEALALTDGGTTHIIAGLESHGGIYRQPPGSRSYFSLNSSGRVDWPNVSATLARLSLAHPQLLGYRMDDFMSGLAVHEHMGVDELPCNTNSSACWSLADIKNFTDTARRINPKLRFMPVIYLQELGAVAPSGFSFGAPYGGVLDKGAAVTLVASFNLPPASTKVELSMFVRSPFAVEAAGPLCKPNGPWYNATFLQIAVNGRVIQENDLCSPVGGLDHAGLGWQPQLLHSDITAAIIRSGGGTHQQQQHEVTVKVFGKNTMQGKNHQSINVWDLEVITGDAPLPLSISFVNTSTEVSEGWLFARSNAATTPLQFVGGVYACWYQSDPLWPTAHEQELYKALLKSMRRALPSGALLLTTHFDSTNWAASHGGAANSIRPEDELGIMLADGPLADGVMIWWDQLGITQDIERQLGIFAPATSEGCCCPLPGLQVLPRALPVRDHVPERQGVATWLVRSLHAYGYEGCERYGRYGGDEGERSRCRHVHTRQT